MKMSFRMQKPISVFPREPNQQRRRYRCPIVVALCARYMNVIYQFSVVQSMVNVIIYHGASQLQHTGADRPLCATAAAREYLSEKSNIYTRLNNEFTDQQCPPNISFFVHLQFRRYLAKSSYSGRFRFDNPM